MKIWTHKSPLDLRTKNITLLAMFLVFSFISLFPASQKAEAQDGNQFGLRPAISIETRYQFFGIAGPDGESPEIYDDIVYPIFLLNEDDETKYVSYTKFNVSDTTDLLSRSFGKFVGVETGTYKVCYAFTAPATVDTNICTPLFDYTENTERKLVQQFNQPETIGLVETALVFDVNGKPCSGSQIGWIVCPITKSLFSTVSTVYENVFRGLLTIDPLDENADDGSSDLAIFEIWNSFRVVATVLFVILFLVAIFAQGLGGFEIFSAYSFKKIIPRLVIAAIGIQLSWYLVGFMVDVFNVLGYGVRGLILAPVEGFDSVEFDASKIGANITLFVSSAGLITTFFAVGGVLGIIFMMPILFMNILLALIFGIVVLLLRNAGILLGVVVSPVALAMWVLPNTQGLFMFWWNTMWRLLVMYPLIIGLIAVGELAARVVVAGNENSILWSIVGIVVLFAPFFAIPYTFRVAQNVLGSVTTGLDGQRQKITDRMFGNPEDHHSYRARQRSRRRRYGTQRRYNRNYKHFMSPGKQKRPGIQRYGKGGYRLPFGKRRYFKGAKGVALPGMVQSSGRDVRKSWKPRTVIRKGTPDLQGSRRKEGMFGLGYLASLPRFALRTPGRVYARMTSRAAAMTGLMGMDEMMGVRNREARDQMEVSSQEASRDAFAHALFGDYNLFSGKRLDADVINAAIPHRKDDSMIQENMKWLFNKSAGIPYRRQLLIDHWMGFGHPLAGEGYQPYENEDLQPFLNGMIKGVSFGTQTLYRDNKHRTWFKLKRMPTGSERVDHRVLSEIPLADRNSGDFLKGGGLLEDRKLHGGLIEAVNLMGDGQIAGFSGTNIYMYQEAQERLHDILKVEGDATLAAAAADPQNNQAVLRSELSQPTAKRDSEGNFVFSRNGEIEIAGFDARDTEGLTDLMVHEDVAYIASLRESLLDTIAQGDIGVDVGDDDTPDSTKPEVGLTTLASRWRKADIAEVEYIKAETIKNKGVAPKIDKIRNWRIAPVGAGGLRDDLANNASTLQDKQNERIKAILQNASNSRMSEYTTRAALQFIRDTSWVTNEAYLDGLNSASGLLPNVKGIVKGR